MVQSAVITRHAHNDPDPDAAPIIFRHVLEALARMEGDILAVLMVADQMTKGFVDLEVDEEESETLREVLKEGCWPSNGTRRSEQEILNEDCLHEKAR